MKRFLISVGTGLLALGLLGFLFAEFIVAINFIFKFW